MIYVIAIRKYENNIDISNITTSVGIGQIARPLVSEKGYKVHHLSGSPKNIILLFNCTTAVEYLQLQALLQINLFFTFYAIYLNMYFIQLWKSSLLNYDRLFLIIQP